MRACPQGFCLVAVGFVAWFTLICIKVLPFSLLQLYISSIGAGLCINATMPLFYEAAIEVRYYMSSVVQLPSARGPGLLLCQPAQLLAFLFALVIRSPTPFRRVPQRPS